MYHSSCGITEFHSTNDIEGCKGSIKYLSEEVAALILIKDKLPGSIYDYQLKSLQQQIKVIQIELLIFQKIENNTIEPVKVLFRNKYDSLARLLFETFDEGIEIGLVNEGTQLEAMDSIKERWDIVMGLLKD
jgi:hypothetical protein